MVRCSYFICVLNGKVGVGCRDSNVWLNVLGHYSYTINDNSKLARIC